MKRAALVGIILVMILGSVGCSGSDQGEPKELTKRETVMVYNSLKGAYFEAIDYFEARQNNKITKFDWRVMAAASRSQCRRMAEMVKTSEKPIAKDFVQLANDIISLVDEFEENVNHGVAPDLSYKEKIESRLEALEPEIEQLRHEVLESQRK